MWVGLSISFSAIFPVELVYFQYLRLVFKYATYFSEYLKVDPYEREKYYSGFTESFETHPWTKQMIDRVSKMDTTTGKQEVLRLPRMG